MKTFLAAGDVLINPALLAYVAVETDSDGPRLRLGFAGQAEGSPAEVRLGGLEARSVLRWLRSNAEFLDPGRPPFGGRSAAEASPAEATAANSTRRREAAASLAV